ncbi:MAG: hypothetical protein K6F00_12090, partial [Lachnospiraceae bacterium]|nr:hypothetical protein [Lachnospiraceae bacterium]
MENEKDTRKPGVGKDRMILICSCIVAVLLVATEVIMLMEQRDQIPIIAGIAIFFVVTLFLLINSLININQYNKSREREEFEELYRAQKASYLIIRKSFDELQDRIDDLEDHSHGPGDDVLNAQKALAKVTISRNKENTDALMNSNELLYQKISKMEEHQNEMNHEAMQEQMRLIEDAKRDYASKSDELRREISRVYDSIRGMQQSIAAIEQNQRNLSMQQPVMMAVQAMQQPVGHAAQPMPQPVPMPEPAPIPEPEMSFSEPMFESPESDNISSVDTQEFSEDIMPEAAMEPEAVPEPEAAAEPEPVPEPEAVAEPEAAVEPEAVSEPEAAAEPEAAPEPEAAAEPEAAPEPEAAAELEAAEPEAVPEPAAAAEPEAA